MKDTYILRINQMYGAEVDLMPLTGPKGDFMYVNRIIVPAYHRGQGWGKKIMSQVCADADAEGMTLVLHVNPYGDLDYENLTAWYGRLGFVLEGEGLWVRRPK